MAINRRNFLRVVGVTGATIAIGKELNAAPSKKSNIEFSGTVLFKIPFMGVS